MKRVDVSALRIREQAALIAAASRDVFHGNVSWAVERLSQFDNSEDEQFRAASGLDIPWEQVMNQLRSSQAVVEMRHGAPVYSVAISPDSRLVASGDGNGVIRIWELTTGKLIALWPAHDGEVRALQFSPAGDRLASGGCFHHLRIWSTATWEKLSEVDAHDGTITCLAWHPDGGTLWTGGRDNFVRCWRTDSELKNLAEFARGDCINQLQIRADGKMLFCTDKTRRVSCLSLEHPQSELKDLFTDDNRTKLAISSDGSFGLTTARSILFLDDRLADVEKARGSEEGTRFRFVGGSTKRAAVIGPGNSWGALVGDSGLAEFWRWHGATPWEGFSFQTWRGHSNTIHDVAASPDGNSLVTASADGLVRVWRVADFDQPTGCWFHQIQTTAPSSIAFSLDSQQLACTTATGCVTIFSTRKHQRLRRLDLRKLNLPEDHFDFPWVGFADDNQTVLAATVGAHSGIVIWNTDKREAEYRLIETPPLRSFSVSSNGRWMAALVDAVPPHISIWDTHTFQELQLAISEGSQPPVLLSPDGRRLSYRWETPSETHMTLVNLDTRQEIATPNLERPIVNSCRFDGAHLYLLGESGNLHIVQAATGKEIALQQVTSGPLRFFHSFDISPDRRFGAFGLNWGEIMLWQMELQCPALSLKPYHLAAAQVRWSPDGRMIAAVAHPTGAPDIMQGVFLWHLAPRRSLSQSDE